MTAGRGGRAAMLAAAAGLCSVAALPAPAQAQTHKPPQNAADAPVEFDIPSQSLARALNAWALQANAQLFVDPGPLAHLTAPAVKGALPPRQALRALLAHSNLEVAQSRDGVFVIKPRRLLAAAPKPHAPITPAPGPAAAFVVEPAALAASVAQEGPWQLRFDASYIDDTGSGSRAAAVTVGGEYFLSHKVAVALSVGSPHSDSFVVPADRYAASYLASAHVQTSTLGLKYFFVSEQPLRPYLGAGVAVAVLSESSGTRGLDHTAVGPAVQLGLDWALTPHWSLNVDASWAQVRPGFSTNPGASIRIDPLHIELGVAYRFGAQGLSP